MDWTEHGELDWLLLARGVREDFIICPYLFNLYEKYLLREIGLA